MGETSSEAVMAELLRDPKREKAIQIKELKRRKRRKRRLVSQRDAGLKMCGQFHDEVVAGESCDIGLDSAAVKHQETVHVLDVAYAILKAQIP